MRAGEDAANVTPVFWADDRAAQVARRRGVLQLASFGQWMHVDVAIGAVVRAQATADAVLFDLDFETFAVAMDRVDGATNQAIRIGARAAGAGHEPFVEPQPFANEPRHAAVRIGTSLGAFIAAGAGFEIEDQQPLGVVESLLDELAAKGRE